MGLLKQSQNQYYSGKKSFTGDGVTTKFQLSKNTTQFPTTFNSSGIAQDFVKIYVDGSSYPQESVTGASTSVFNYSLKFSALDKWHIEFTATSIPASGAAIGVEVDTTIYQAASGGMVETITPYQFTSLKDVINNFIVAYTGEDKIIMKANRTDIQFHAMRALQELSFDTFKSTKSQEIEVPPSLKMILPHDYVNYVKLTTKDSNGMERVLYPAINSSDPFAIKQKTDGSYDFDMDNTADGWDESSDLISPDNSDTWNAFKTNNSVSSGIINNNDYNNDYSNQFQGNSGRYGIDPSKAQINGGFYINDAEGYIHFSSAMAGSTITLKYISDSLGTDEEMQVHKFAEEAMYKHIMYAILSTRMNIPEHIVQRFKKERFAETRKAKLRLSNIKLEEITQVLRGKSKFIKH